MTPTPLNTNITNTDADFNCDTWFMNIIIKAEVETFHLNSKFRIPWIVSNLGFSQKIPSPGEEKGLFSKQKSVNELTDPANEQALT